ncbi:MAG: CaiB/BaiF CoA transferase family protein, partial [Acidimicrobiia bacterium]
MSLRSGGLLDGVRVVDLSRVLAGPFGAWILAEAGAEVVKVEPPEGDPARAIGPSIGGRSLYFSSLNSGKRGVCLDLTTPADSQVLESLLADADVVVENFRPQAARKLGVEPDALLARHPRLVVVSVVGYSRSTDRGDRASFDLAIQAETGLMAVTGEPGREPVRAGVPLADLAAGM